MGRRLLSVTLLAVLVTAGAGNATPMLSFTRGVPGDVRALTRTTWERFADAFAGRRSCLVPVTVATAWRRSDRADYDPRRHLVTIRIPGTGPNLTASLIHEFAHHVDFACGARGSLRGAFLAAQRFPPGTPWRHGPSWESTPSEQFAEATVTTILGEPSVQSGMWIRPQAVAVIRRWASGHDVAASANARTCASSGIASAHANCPAT